MNPGRFTGRSALVTGAARGLGACVAERLASNGATVALLDREAAGVDAVAKRVRTNGGRAIGVGCDVSDDASVTAAVAAAAEAFGGLDLVVTGAGIMRVANFLDVSPGDFRVQLDVNLTGTFLTVQHCARYMVAAGIAGSVVCISSVAGRGPRPDAAAYAASKAGVISLVRSAAVALAPHRITVNAVCPGVVDTEMTRNNARQRAATEGITESAVIEGLVSRIPLGRMQTTEDVADVIEFLLSPAGSYLTGQALNACGGLEFD